MPGLPDLHDGLQEAVDRPRRHGLHVLEQRRDAARQGLSAQLGPHRRRLRPHGQLGPRRCPPPRTTARPGSTTTRSGSSRAARSRSCPTTEAALEAELGRGPGRLNGADNYYFYLPRICNHCTHPACVEACPRKAIYKRDEDGIVLIDQDRCQGYRHCIQACPYKKIYFNEVLGKSQKCIFCYPRLEKGKVNACAASVPAGCASSACSTIPNPPSTSWCKSTESPWACCRSAAPGRTSTTCRRSTRRGGQLRQEPARRPAHPAGLPEIPVRRRSGRRAAPAGGRTARGPRAAARARCCNC